FNVPMNNESRMCMGQRVGHSGDNPRRLTPGGAVFPQPTPQVNAFQVIGNDVNLSVVHPDVVHCNNTRVTQLGELTRFTHVLLFPARARFAAHDLNSYLPVELRVMGKVYLAEAALSESAPYLVTAEASRRLAWLRLLRAAFRRAAFRP